MKLTTRCLFLFLLLLWRLPGSAATIVIEVGDNFYRPADVTIKPGDVVRWVNVGSNSHPTVSDSNPAAWATFTISPAANNTSKEVSFATAGTFNYHCAAHSVLSNGQWIGQTGVIRVSGTATPTLAAKALLPSMSVFPNPSRGVVTISVAQKLPWSDYKFRINNILGREVRTVTLRPEAADGGMSLNLSDLPAGMYFYSLVQNDKVVSTRRLVLQN